MRNLNGTATVCVECFMLFGEDVYKRQQVGDTITDANNPTPLPQPGYRKAVSMVYCGLYPVESNQYGELKDALDC